MKQLVNLSNITTKTRKTYNVVKILGKKHAPVILMGIGAAGLVATAVTSYRAAKKVDKKVTEFEELKSKGIVVEKREMAIEIGKELAVPVLIGTASLGCILLSYNIQNNRLKALTTALAVATEEHSRYRLRAKEILDESTFKKVDAPTEVAKVEIDGKEKEVAKIVEGDFYGKWFIHSREYVADSPVYNEQFIREYRDWKQIGRAHV